MNYTDSERLRWCIKHNSLPMETNYIGFTMKAPDWEPAKPKQLRWVITGRLGVFRGESPEEVIDQAMQQEILDILSK